MYGRGSVKESIKQYEEKTGSFSRYACDGGITGEQISFKKKPAQQFLAALGCSSNSAEPLTLPDKGYKIRDVTIAGFTNGSKAKLIITKDRIDELNASAKVYTNPDIITASTYQQVSGTLSSQDAGKSPDGEAWQNLAAGVCHAQKIDLLVQQSISEEGKSVTAEKSGRIDKGATGIMLLSTPALNFAYGAAVGMPDQKAEHYIKNMYRLLFSAALDNDCTHITLPAAGLGVFGGNPDIYFKCMLEAAKEYPELNVIYNPAQFGKQFSDALDKFEKSGGTNVAVTNRDVLFLADEMAKDSIKCAMHNPSDADAVYGAYDVGQYWKNGKGAGYVGEEHIGAMSTAPFNSRGLNREIFDNPIELKPRLTSQAVKQQQPQADQAPQKAPRLNRAELLAALQAKSSKEPEVTSQAQPSEKATIKRAELLAALKEKAKKAPEGASQEQPVQKTRVTKADILALGAKKAPEVPSPAAKEPDKPAPAKESKLKKSRSGINTEALEAARASITPTISADAVAKMTPAQLIDAANKELTKQFPNASIESTSDGIVIKINVKLTSPPPHKREYGAEQFNNTLAEMNIKHAATIGSYIPFGGRVAMLQALIDSTPPEVYQSGPVVAVTAQIGISDIQALLSKQAHAKTTREKTTPDISQQAQAQPLNIRLETADVKKLQQHLQFVEPRRTIKDKDDLKEALEMAAVTKQTTLPPNIVIQQVGSQFNIQVPKDQQMILMKLLDKPQVEIPVRKENVKENETPTPVKPR